VRKRGKKHDYFTSCLPFAQKGDDIFLPIGSTAPVIGDGLNLGLVSDFTSPDSNNRFGPYTVSSQTDMGIGPNAYGAAVGTTASAGVSSVTKSLGVTGDPDNSGLVADLSASTAVTINQLREAVAFQHILERDARSGTRYTEILKGRWGVTVPDFRLQRPEYLGGSTQRINISAVPQTSPSPATPTNRDVQGGLAAYATVADRSGFVKSFSEYGYVLGLVNVRADISYQQGLRKLWSRNTRLDFAMPELMHLGEQPVLRKEIFLNDTTGETVFGYQERYAEYRYFPSVVTGPFRSDYTTSLHAWHLATYFGSAPSLNDAFIQDSPPLDRVLAVTDEPNILLDVYVSLRHARCMPTYAVPGLERL